MADTAAIEIARTISDQLGGQRFALMTGASKFFALDSGLQFHLPSTRGYVRDGINLVKIILEVDDTYTIEFFRFNQRVINLLLINKVEGVYAENLQEVFTEYTGLYTRFNK